MYKPRILKPPKCPHPGCPEPWHPDPWMESQCVLNKPLLLYIPPGQHVHMACPAHPGGHVLYGSNITWCNTHTPVPPPITAVGQYTPTTTTWGEAQSPPPYESTSRITW